MIKTILIRVKIILNKMNITRDVDHEIEWLHRLHCLIIITQV